MSGSNHTLLLSVRRYFDTRRARKSEAMRGCCDCSSIFLLPIVLATVSVQFLFEVQLAARYTPKTVKEVPQPWRDTT